MRKVFVRYSDGTEEFKSRKEAVKDILARFAESGQNDVDEAWEENADGEVTRALGCTWSLRLLPPRFVKASRAERS